jgi:hypothetical protein
MEPKDELAADLARHSCDVDGCMHNADGRMVTTNAPDLRVYLCAEHGAQAKAGTLRERLPWTKHSPAHQQARWAEAKARCLYAASQPHWLLRGLFTW